jgi:hypothetical protein
MAHSAWLCAKIQAGEVHTIKNDGDKLQVRDQLSTSKRAMSSSRRRRFVLLNAARFSSVKSF